MKIKQEIFHRFRHTKKTASRWKFLFIIFLAVALPLFFSIAAIIELRDITAVKSQKVKPPTSKNGIVIH